MPVIQRLQVCLAADSAGQAESYDFGRCFKCETARARRPSLQAVRTVLMVADLEQDLMRRLATRGRQGIDLLPKEYTLLKVLMRSEGRVVKRTMLMERVWDFHFNPKTIARQDRQTVRGGLAAHYENYGLFASCAPLISGGTARSGWR